MATRSAIVLADRYEAEGGGASGPALDRVWRLKGRAIYVHWDGYPAWTGRILGEAYWERDRVERLLALGYLSQLGPFLSPEELTGAGVPCRRHTFERPCPGVTIAYGRDRRERDVAAREVVLEGEGETPLEALGEMFWDKWGAEWVYLGLPEGDRVRWYAYGVLEGEVREVWKEYPPTPPEKWAREALMELSRS